MSAVVEIRSTLMADLRRRYPNLRPHHDDLSNDTIADLLQWLQGRSAAPSDEEKLKIARRILQRRIADFFRARVRVAPSEEQASTSQPDREAQIRRLSSVVFAAMGKLTSGERSLLIDALQTSTAYSLARNQMQLVIGSFSQSIGHERSGERRQQFQVIRVSSEGETFEVERRLYERAPRSPFEVVATESVIMSA